MASEEPRYFELPLESYNGKIPFIVVDLIEEMRRRHVENFVGIFRLNGSDSRVKEIIERYNHGPINDLSSYTDINNLSTTLKRYFRYMAEQHRPLIPYELYDCFIGLMGCGVEEREIEVSKSLVKNMTPCSLKTLAYLCKFLKDITENQAVNNMTSSNLAICIAPNILVPQSPTESLMTESGLSNSALDLMIRCYDQIFDDVVITEDDFCNDEDIASLNAPKVNIEKLKHLIARCKLREGSLIPYIPICRLLKSPCYARPTKEPPHFDDVKPAEPVAPVVPEAPAPPVEPVEQDEHVDAVEQAEDDAPAEPVEPEEHVEHVDDIEPDVSVEPVAENPVE
ncbi:RhoGAP domain containing protein [Histomonas meleagridis]|uniref:RhoGAP domain containing protein n=1 Tax=Histomonas meleagridis TaxID=135588 RepID=UPI00355AB14F|nr:RhoGAP domain containing protein [Histomonas meleagridis]KAH0802745.1 RhoGAP domain containing protein [Histomonas meleagridis]